MILIRLKQPGGGDLERTIEGDSAWIGRDASCDVVIEDPHISKRHLLVLNGLVVFDKSTNGSFVGGDRIQVPTLLKDGRILLGRERIEVTIEAQPESEPTRPVKTAAPARNELAALRAELEQERRRIVTLDSELAEARERVAKEQAGAAGRLLELQQQNEDLKRRLATIKGEVEDREVAASASLQARLAGEELREVQGDNQRLGARVQDLEARLRAASSGGASAESAEAVRQKEAEIVRLHAELESARASQGGSSPSDLFANLQKQVRELRTKLAQYESGDSHAGLPASELFFRLQSENRELRKKVQEFEQRGPAASPASGSAPAAPTREGSSSAADLAAARRQVEAVERELRQLRSTAAPAAGTASRASGVLPLILAACEQDFDARKPLLVGPPEDFVVLESLRSLRALERLVTRFAGSYIQLYNTHTQLPGLQGNVRTLLKAAIELGEDPAPREALLKYRKELGAWLIAALGAPRKAAEEFALELKRDLAEEGLTRDRPISSMKMLAAQREAELWRRVGEYMKELSPDVVNDRLEKLTRRYALELRESA